MTLFSQVNTSCSYCGTCFVSSLWQQGLVAWLRPHPSLVAVWFWPEPGSPSAAARLHCSSGSCAEPLPAHASEALGCTCAWPSPVPDLGGGWRSWSKRMSVLKANNLLQLCKVKWMIHIFSHMQEKGSTLYK